MKKILKHFHLPPPPGPPSFPSSWLPSLRPVLMLFFHLLLRFAGSLFPRNFRTKILYYAFLVSPIQTTCPAHHSFLDVSIITILKTCRNHGQCYPKVTTSFIFFFSWILFFQAILIYSSPKVKDHFSTHTTAGKINTNKFTFAFSIGFLCNCQK